ncbi:cbb3-type cytochrome c oxidase subunit I, partial [Gilvimarinus sp. SDUM040013]
WVPAHVHVGTLGWNGFIAFGMIYYLAPKLFNTKLASVKMANAHFWIGTFGILFWVIPMYVAGWTQGLMWKQFAADGTLEYGNFLQTVTILKKWLYPLRAFGGTLYLLGSILMI